MSRHYLWAATALCATAIAFAAPATAGAQGFGDRLKKKAQEAAKRKLEQRAEKRAGEATDKALDTVECAATDKLCQDKQAATAGGVAAATGKPGEGVWANYDFTPGGRPLFVTDFSDDDVGDFPRRLELVDGNVEVVEWGGRRFLRAMSRFTLRIPLPETLPERFTLEFDLHSNHTTAYGSAVKIDFGMKENADHVVCGTMEAGIYGRGGFDRKAVMDIGARKLQGTVIRCRIMADGKYTKVYVNEMRVANHPNTTLGRARSITIGGEPREETPLLIGDIRVAAGGRKLYDALSASGRVATQGIFFDTGSDRIRPESTPTLKEIGQMLTEHPDLELTIEGHTDNVGDAKANHDLSQRRAAAVKTYLVSKHGIGESRLSSTGLGDKKPVAPNTTPEGRQQNRRVELVKK